MSSGLYFFSNVIYVLFGTAELADWNNPKIDSEEVEEAGPMIKKDEEKKEKN